MPYSGCRCATRARPYRVVAPDGFVYSAMPMCSACAAYLRLNGYKVTRPRKAA